VILIMILIILFVFYEYRTHTYLIENGSVIFKNLNDSYNLESLIKDLIKNKVTDINNIEKAYLFLGRLKIKKNKPLVIISNGKIDYEALFKSKKGINFIYKLLKEKSIKLDQVLYAIYLNERFYIVKI